MKSSSSRIFAWLLIATSCLALTYSPAHSLAQSNTTIKIMPESVRLRVNETAKIDLTIDQVSGLYGAEFRLQFSPDALEIVDAQPDQAGVQIQAGTMPIPDFVVINTVDNQAGTIDYAVTQLPPNEPGEGDGVIASLTVHAKTATSTQIQIERFLLADTAGKSIEATSQHGQIKITGGSNWMLYIFGAILLLGLVTGIGFIIIKK